MPVLATLWTPSLRLIDEASIFAFTLAGCLAVLACGVVGEFAKRATLVAGPVWLAVLFSQTPGSPILQALHGRWFHPSLATCAAAATYAAMGFGLSLSAVRQGTFKLRWYGWVCGYFFGGSAVYMGVKYGHRFLDWPISPGTALLVFIVAWAPIAAWGDRRAARLRRAKLSVARRAEPGK
ncbi:MAG: hypothetical protein AAF288_12590 [Planctomycetota bacterium]